MWLQDKFFIWWLHGPRYGWSKLRRRLFEGGFLDKPLPEVNSLQDIQKYLSEVKWKRDLLPELFDCVSYPQRVWKRKKDDCDGFSVLAAELLKRWDPNTRPVMVTAMVTPMEHCHSVCVFRQGVDLRYFDNKRLSPNLFVNYREIVDNFTPPHRLICWDVVRLDTLEQLEFHVV
jgi:hypothetical protein